MIDRRGFLGILPSAGILGFLGFALKRPAQASKLEEPPNDASWDWWRNLPRTPLARSNDPMTNSLCQAAMRRQEVTILYDGGSQPGVHRRISPLGVFMVEGFAGIYVHAYCHSRQAQRTFRIEHITALV